MKKFFKNLTKSFSNYCLPIVFLLSILLPKVSLSSHVSGGDISFQCIGPNTYQITLNLFRDCSGITMSNSEFIDAVSSCGGTQTITMDLTNIDGTNISQLCPVDSLNSTCFGGTLPGMQIYTYTGTVVLAPPCDTWTLSWSTCCRNTTVNVPTSTSDDIYIQTTLNTITAPCNNSPFFTSQPIPYVCANQPVNYNFGASEPDGDSLSFEFISAMLAGGGPLTYAAGYSGTSPLPGVTIDSQTGQITFNSTTQGNFIVVVQCNEYDDAGNLISTTMRDIQFVVLACSNTVPNSNVGQVTNLVGNAVATGPNSIDICEGNTFSFTSTYTDPNPGDSLFVTTNMNLVLPGSSYTVSGFNPLTVVYTWTVPPGSAGTNTTFIVQIEDNACPITGMQTFVYDINVLDRTLAYPNQTICGNQSAQLSASGGSVFTWKDMSGNIIPVSPQFSCNPCANPIATPSTTTSYVVESNLVGSCINSDTVTVTVVPDFNFTMSSSQSSACLLQPVQLQSTVNPPGLYNYFWTPATVMSNSIISNPTANFSQSGNYTVSLTVQSPFGCVKEDTLQVNISANVAPVVSIISDTVCVGNPNQLQVQFASTIPTSCGTTTVPCLGPTLNGTIGTGASSNSGTTYPNVFGNWYWGSKHQILYTAADLISMGFSGGKISSIGFDVINLNTSTTSYQNFEIKMKCTNATSLGAFETGLQTVFPSQTVTPVIGWNTFNLSPLYEWDGVSNLIIEICSNNSSYTNNCSNTYTVTGYNSVVYFFQDASGVCSGAGTPTASNQRPNTRFNFCAGVADPTQFIYQWSNPNNVSNPSILNPITTINFDTTYTVIVTAIQGGCSDTAQITISNLTNPGIVDIIPPPSFTYCLNDPPIILTASSPGGVWSGVGVDPITGVFTPSIAGIGNHEIIYLVSGSVQCDSRDTIYLEVTGSLNAMINYTGPTDLCITNSPISLVPMMGGGSWSGIGVDTITGVFSPMIAGVGSHVITYSLGTGNCVDVGQITFNVFPELNDSITQFTTLCQNDGPLLLYSATSGGTWSGQGVTNSPIAIFEPQVSGDGLFVLNYSYSGVCSFNSITSINVLPPPPTPIISNNSPICENENLQFITMTIPNGQYIWSGPNNFSSNLQNPQINSVDLLDSGRYTCSVSVNGCSSLIGSSDVVINPTPNLPIINSNDPICEGEDLVLFTNPQANSTFLWSGPGGFSTTNREFTIGFATPSASGQYEIIAISNGCISPQNSISVVVNPNPLVSFLADPQTTDILSPQIIFSNSSSAGQYFWNFGDGITSTSISPIHIYSDTGTYTVSLSVTNPQTLCFSQSSQTVIIEPHFRMFIPNSFTPNGDGLNDDFKVHIEFYKTFEMVIYNRWGEIMAISIDPNQVWNGKINNNEVQQGVYPYQVTVVTLEGEFKKFTGSLTILR